jgi:predicted aspartyl protease
MHAYLPLHILPIENQGCQIVFRAVINNHAASLLVDTGASHTLFDRQRLERFGPLSTNHSVSYQAKGLGNEIDSFILDIGKLMFHGHRIDDYHAILMDLDALSEIYTELLGEPIHGILGGDLLFKFDAIINYKKQVIKLSKKKEPLFVLTLNHDTRHFLLKTQIQGHTANLIVDTGASTTVFNISTFHDLHPYNADDLRRNEQTSSGIHAEYIFQESIVLDKLEMGPFTFNGFQAMTLDLSNINQQYRLLGLPPVDGLIGSDFLLARKAVINYRKRHIRISKPKA